MSQINLLLLVNRSEKHLNKYLALFVSIKLHNKMLLFSSIYIDHLENTIACGNICVCVCIVFWEAGEGI